MAAARDLGQFMGRQGQVRAWGTGLWIEAGFGTPVMHDRVFAVTDKSLAWGRSPHIAFVEVDFRENLAIDPEQVENGSWTVAFIPTGHVSSPHRYPSLFNFARVLGGDLEDSGQVAQFLATKFPRHGEPG